MTVTISDKAKAIAELELERQKLMQDSENDALELTNVIETLKKISSRNHSILAKICAVEETIERIMES